jgi:hypothetical protein
MRPKFVVEHPYRSGRPRHKIVVTRLRAAIVVVVGYAALALVARFFLVKLQSLQGISDDQRVADMTLVFGGVMVVLACWSLFNVFRRPKLFDE